MADGTPDDKPQIGMVIEHAAGKFRVLRNIASGPFSDVFIVADADDRKKKYAMKCERQNGNVRAVLKLDVMVLNSMKQRNAIGFPATVAVGRTEGYKFIIMQLLGPDLGKLRRSVPDKKFTMGTALKVGLQALDRLQALHDAGWLCRDVKAPNLVIGSVDEGDDLIYMLDFGFARKFRDAEGRLIPPRANAALVGTFQYAPLAAHAHKDQAPKDDLESWLYMVIELMRGPLPWGSLKDYHDMGTYKKSLREERRAEFFKALPEQIPKIMDMIDKLDYFDTPDYDGLRRELHVAALRDDLDLTTLPFDWQIQRWMLRRAVFVGDLGESNLASARLAEADATTADSDDDRSSLPIDRTPPIDAS